MRTLPRTHRRRAFTMLELIVVIVILGILALLAVPTFSKVVAKSQDATTITTLQAVARDAQTLRAIDSGVWDASNLDAAIGETSHAAASGTQAAAGIYSVYTGSSDPSKDQIGYRIDGEGVLLSTTSGSGRVCIVGASYTSTTAGSCKTAAEWSAGVATGGTATSSSMGNAMSSSTSPLPAGTKTSGAPVLVAPASTALTVTKSGASANLTWSAVVATTNAPVSGYKVYRGTGTSEALARTAAGAETTPYKTVSAPGVTDADLTVGSYCYSLAVYNSVGDSARSAIGCIEIVPTTALAYASRISAGNTHSCAVSNEALKCWGANAFGQLGNGTTTNSLTPVAVTGMSSGVTAVTTGSDWTCAIKDGAAYCWGYGTNGVLGNGVNAHKSVPTMVSGMSSGVAEINATPNASNVCLVKNGGAYCWGTGSNGELGTGNNNSSGTPVAVSGMGEGTGVTSITVQTNGGCAVQAGAAKCWGYNPYGTLGNGTTTESNVPVQVTGMSTGVTFIESGQNSTCAVQNGGLKCWGSNGDGQLGNNTTSNSSFPVSVSSMSSGVTSLSAGNGYACAIKSGAGYCWGSNSGRKMGSAASNPLVPTLITSFDANVTAVSAGFNTSCGVQSGVVKCWGLNGSGQVGDGSTTTREVPTNVSN